MAIIHRLLGNVLEQWQQQQQQHPQWRRTTVRQGLMTLLTLQWHQRCRFISKLLRRMRERRKQETYDVLFRAVELTPDMPFDTVSRSVVSLQLAAWLHDLASSARARPMKQNFWYVLLVSRTCRPSST